MYNIDNNPNKEKKKMKKNETAATVNASNANAEAFASKLFINGDESAYYNELLARLENAQTETARLEIIGKIQGVINRACRKTLKASYGTLTEKFSALYNRYLSAIDSEKVTPFEFSIRIPESWTKTASTIPLAGFIGRKTSYITIAEAETLLLKIFWKRQANRGLFTMEQKDNKFMFAPIKAGLSDAEFQTELYLAMQETVQTVKGMKSLDEIYK